MDRKIEVSPELVAKFRRMFDEHSETHGIGDTASPDEAGGFSPGGDDRVLVRVSLLVGDEALIVLAGGTTERFPAQWIAEQVGAPVAKLPGMWLVAVVEGGELAGFAAK